MTAEVVAAEAMPTKMMAAGKAMTTKVMAAEVMTAAAEVMTAAAKVTAAMASAAMTATARERVGADQHARRQGRSRSESKDYLA